jgi:hypothetical protein
MGARFKPAEIVRTAVAQNAGAPLRHLGAARCARLLEPLFLRVTAA